MILEIVDYFPRSLRQWYSSLDTLFLDVLDGLIPNVMSKQGNRQLMHVSTQDDIKSVFK